MKAVKRKGLNLGRWYPMGYEYEKELGWAAGLAGAGLCGSLHFFEALYREMQRLYYYVEGEQFLQEGAMAASFTGMTDWYWPLWIPVLIFLSVMPLYHYYYYRKDTKSIYVMRRLPRGSVLFKSCVRGPLWSAGAVLGAAALLYLFYFWIYLLNIPETMGRFA